MKTSVLNKIFLILTIVIFASSKMSAQVASWSFNNVLTGTGSANSIAGNASLGSTIAAGGAFNGGTVYYGEGSWPSGGIDLNAYLEFSITPTAGHTLTISGLSMQIRRSTTGSSGAGPNTWSLRSSLDGYATDISSGVLSTNSSPATVVSLGIAFMNIPSKIIFRLYGYNATVSSGGLSRFVYDDIVANGSTVLPVVMDYFNVKAVNQQSVISWKLGGEGNLNSMLIERAASDNDFQIIKQYNAGESNEQKSFEYTDQLNNPSGNYAYRIEMISTDGQSSYSAVDMVSYSDHSNFQLQAINTGNSNAVSFRVNVEKPGNYIFSLLNCSGNKMDVKSIQLTAGSQVLTMDNKPLKAGIYILIGENGNQKISTKLMVL
jgi:hypothetical protein